MLALLVPAWWHWAIFVVCILGFLALDLGVFHRHAHVVKFREAAMWTLVWFTLAMGFAFLLAPAVVHGWGRRETMEFVTGYIVELSLSMDNVFVIALLFAYFRTPAAEQHRVLFWGILGALVMRGVMIGTGAALVERFQWTLYVFGGFLILTGVKMLFARTEEVHPEKNLVLRLAKKFFPVTTELDGERFLTRLNGRTALTPLALVLLLVETTDLLFALDSIPAIFGVTRKPFIVFTSNVFAILGLRSLYFVLAAAIDYFRYLKAGLALVLTFIGVKMLLDPHDATPAWYQVDIETGLSLGVVGGIIFLAIALSVIKGWWEKQPRRAG